MKKILKPTKEKLFITALSLVIASLFYIFQSVLTRFLIDGENVENISYIATNILPCLSVLFVFLKYYVIICFVIYLVATRHKQTNKWL